MSQADANGQVTFKYHLVFAGLTWEGKPNFYHVEGEHWKPGGQDANGGSLPDGWQVLGHSIEVTFQVPADFNPMTAAIAGLDEEIQAVRAAAELKVQELTQKKNDLLMLGHTASTEAFPYVPF